MRYIDKDLTDIPDSLIGNTSEILFNKIIKEKRFKSSRNSNRKYSNRLVRDSLNAIYYEKCAYCESKVNENFLTIEHFRPKNGGYYWLSTVIHN